MTDESRGAPAARWIFIPGTRDMPARICTDPRRMHETEKAVVYGDDSNEIAKQIVDAVNARLSETATPVKLLQGLKYEISRSLMGAPFDRDRWLLLQEQVNSALKNAAPQPQARPQAETPTTSQAKENADQGSHAPSAVDAAPVCVVVTPEMFRTRVGDSLEVLDAIREALAGQDKEQIIELVNGYIDRASAELRRIS